MAGKPKSKKNKLATTGPRVSTDFKVKEKYIDKFLSPEMDIDLSWTYEAERERQCERLIREAMAAHHIREFTRRLGPDAIREEIAADKRCAKIVFHRVIQIFIQWDPMHDRSSAAELILETYEDCHDAELFQEAAQRDWLFWWENRKPVLQKEVKRVCTHANKLASRKIANQIANRFQNEYNLMELSIKEYQSRMEKAASAAAAMEDE